MFCLLNPKKTGFTFSIYKYAVAIITDVSCVGNYVGK